MKLNKETVELKNLILDPNNPRLKDYKGYEEDLDIKKFSLASTQSRIISTMTEHFEIEIIKNSIEKNGYVNVDQIVVKEYPEEEGMYIVVEGNRRVTACKLILQESDNGKEISSKLLDCIKTLDVLNLVKEEGDMEVENMIKGLRHISGPKEWGAYQKSFVIVDLKDNKELSFINIGEKLGMSARKVSNYYKASKALIQMKNDEEYKEYWNTKYFSLFEETLKKKELKDWLEWSEDEKSFKNLENLRIFYDMILVKDSRIENETRRDHGINNPSDIRNLNKLIIKDDKDYFNKVINDEINIESAAVLAKEIKIKDLSKLFKDFKKNFSEIPMTSYINLGKVDYDLIVETEKKIKEALEIINKLNSYED